MSSLYQKITKSVFIRNFIVYLTGGTVAKGVGFVTFLLLGKLLAPEKYAILVLFLLASDFLSVFVRFGLGSSIIRLAKDDHMAVMNNGIAIILVLWGFIATAILIVGPFVVTHIRPEYSAIADFRVPLCMRILSVSIIEVLGYYYVTLEIPRKFVIVSVATAAFNLIFLIVLILAKQMQSDVASTVVWINAISSMLGMFIALLVSKRFINLSLINCKKAYLVAAESAAFFGKNIIGFFQTYASRVILTVMSTSYLLGVYSFYLIFFTQASWFLSIFNQTYLPKIRNLVISTDKSQYERGMQLVRKTFRSYLLLSGLSLAVILPMLWIVHGNTSLFAWAIRKEYLAHLDLFGFMYFVFLIGNFRTFFEVWQYLKGKHVNMHLLTSNIILLGLLYFGNLYFFRQFGIYGIVVNQLLIYIVHFVYTLFCYQKYVRYKECCYANNQI